MFPREALTAIRQPQRRKNVYPAGPSRRSAALVAGGAAVLLLLAVAGRAARRLARGPLGWKASLRQVLTAVPAPAEETSTYRAEKALTVYDDSLGTGWQDWSWATHDLNATTHVCAGRKALSLLPAEFKGIYFHHTPLSGEGYGVLQLHAFGEAASVNVRLALTDSRFGPQVPLTPRLKGESGLPEGWRVARIPLTELGVGPSGSRTFSGVVFQAAAAARAPEVYLDDISFQPDASLPTAPSEVTVPVTVDTATDLHPISPYIYGMAYAPAGYLTDLRLGANRWGGNDKSRYNWAHGNATNAARDWRWANRTALEHSLTGTASSAADEFIRQNRAAGVATVMTIPTLGWVAKDADNSHTSVGVPAHGGAPLATPEGAVAGYDPAANRARTSLRSAAHKGRPFQDDPGAPDGVVYQDEWVHHLVKKFGTAEQNGVRFYSMDNEPDLWDITHTDVHPARPGYQELLDNFVEYATAVKAVDPTAQITAPVLSGWTGYEYSPLDRGEDNFRQHADRKAHGDEPFLPWFLKQVRAHDQKSGHRTLDVLDVHYYPQGHGVYQGVLDPSTQALRLRLTRGLWDPEYTDESWINQKVRLIPRLKEWVAAGYPGTRLGISEWNFGADTHINGALAIAEVLGIFGREDVFSANYWTYPPHNSPGYLAFKLIRNPDGAGSGFGDTSCRVVSRTPGQLSSFAAVDSRTGDLTVLLVNKQPQTAAIVPLTLGGGQALGAGRGWMLSGRQPSALVPATVSAAEGGTVRVSLPAQSVALVRFTMGGRS